MVRVRAQVECQNCREYGDMYFRFTPDGTLVAQCAECECVLTNPQDDGMGLLRWDECTDASLDAVLQSHWHAIAIAQQNNEHGLL